MILQLFSWYLWEDLSTSAEPQLIAAGDGLHLASSGASLSQIRPSTTALSVGDAQLGKNQKVQKLFLSTHFLFRNQKISVFFFWNSENSSRFSSRLAATGSIAVYQGLRNLCRSLWPPCAMAMKSRVASWISGADAISHWGHAMGFWCWNVRFSHGSQQVLPKGWKRRTGKSKPFMFQVLDEIGELSGPIPVFPGSSGPWQIQRPGEMWPCSSLLADSKAWQQGKANCWKRQVRKCGQTMINDMILYDTVILCDPPESRNPWLEA